VLRVVHVNKAYDRPVPPITQWGGIERALMLLAERQSRTMDVTVLCANAGRRTQTERLGPNLSVVRSARLFSAIKLPVCHMMPQQLRGLRPDIVHLHHPYPPGEFAAYLARPRGKLCITWHSDVLRPAFAIRIYGPILRRLLARADRVLVASPQYLELSRFLSAVREKCRVVPFGIDAAPLMTPDSARVAAARPSPRSRPMVLAVGRCVYYKGLEYLVSAMAAVEATLVIVGEGPLLPDLQAQVERLGLTAKVQFRRDLSQEDLAAHYHACDVFVLPSVAITEAFGLVQLEAMACGKPVVATDLPTGVVYVNRHLETGLIVPPKDPAALAAAINQLLDDPALRSTLGEAARARVMREFTAEVYAGRVAEVYEEMLAE
jgi:rhamnosyl/mannosyltransferase